MLVRTDIILDNQCRSHLQSQMTASFLPADCQNASHYSQQSFSGLHRTWKIRFHQGTVCHSWVQTFCNDNCMASNCQDQMVHCDWLLLGQDFTGGDVTLNLPSSILTYFFIGHTLLVNLNCKTKKQTKSSLHEP